MNIIFMGTPDFAVPALKKIANTADLNISAVVTQPDRARGRGQKVSYSAIKQTALKLDLPVLQNENVNQPEFLEKLKKLKPDFLIVVAFGQKLSVELLELPTYSAINLHASLLPEYRGSSPIHRAIIDGKKITGNTTMHMGPGWDDGDIIYQQEVVIEAAMTVGDLHDKLARSGADLLVKTIHDVAAGTAPRQQQNDQQATFAYKIDKSLGKIDWQQSAQEIFNLIRGVNPWPGAYTDFAGQKMKIWQAEPVINPDFDLSQKAKSGTVVKADLKSGLLIKTGNGLLAIKKLQLPGGKKMTAHDFLNGYQLKEGSILE
jgi:methionyl-tRNA formyltransferase